MNKKIVWVGIVLLAVIAVLVWYFSKSSPEVTETDTSSPQVLSTEAEVSTPAEETLNGCVRTFDESKLSASDVDFRNKQAVIQVEGFGEMTVDLYDADAPQTVENFVRLASSGFYDCLTFHRVSKGFVIQGGDPSGNGTGGRTASGKALPDELNPEAPSYKQGYVKGVLAMANKGIPLSGSSQFFIMLGDVELDHKYTIFGKVTVGQDVVDKIGEVEITPKLGPTDGTPVSPVVMEKIIIKEK